MLSIRNWICRWFKIQPIIHVMTCGDGDVVITKDIMPRLVIAKPIKPGFKRKLKIKADEPLDGNQDNQFIDIKRISGNADSPKIIGESTAQETTVYLFGTGDLGTPNVFAFTADGHVGEGEAVISLEVEYVVNHPDATELTAEESTEEDEAI